MSPPDTSGAEATDAAGRGDGRAYHHGALREALLDAVEAEVGMGGLERVSLRACARRAGVSHAAAFRHFQDKRALLTAFAARSARRLAAAMEAEAARAAHEGERFLLAGVGYLRFAMSEPGAFRAVFREGLIDTDDAEYRAALSALSARLAGGAGGEEDGDGGIDNDGDGALPPEALLAWGATHGLAALHADGSLARDLPPGRELEAMTAALRLLGRVFRPGE